MILYWTHVILALILTLCWAITARNGYIVLLHKKATTYRSLPMLIRTHVRMGWFWLITFAITVGTGYYLPNFSSTTAWVHRWTAVILIPSAIVALWTGLRNRQGEPPASIVHVFFSIVATICVTLSALTGLWMLRGLW